MEGNASEGVAIGSYRFSIASQQHDLPIRRLLQRSPMRGAISMSLECEPSYFQAARLGGASHQTIICRDVNNEIVGLGARYVSEALASMPSTKVGYLSHLRLDARVQGSFQLIRAGYNMLRELHERDGATKSYFSCIMEDNTRARRLLERGLPGFPIYRPIDIFETSILASTHSSREADVDVRTGASGDEPAIMQLLRDCNAGKAFARAWHPNTPGGSPQTGDFMLGFVRGKLVAATALWDLRPCKQVVVRGYSLSMCAVRPMVNAWCRIRRTPSLPPVGSTLPLQYLSFAACQPGKEHVFEVLLDRVITKCRARGCWLVAGFASKHPLARIVQCKPRRCIRSVVYAVAWPDGDKEALGLQGALVQPEVALL